MKNYAENYAQDRLREVGIRVTAPRLRIFEYLLENRTHPTCDDIYKDLKSQDDSMSLASVYNVTLKLTDVGLINELVSPDGQKHYDSVIDFHGHFYCKECGKIYDVTCRKDVVPKSLDNAKIDSVSLMISGTCNPCLNSETPA
ncbi:MAG: transcriptional repressor [Clostridiales bacterium]|nr:transcriptional repressor [Clostridiales bacterium]